MRQLELPNLLTKRLNILFVTVLFFASCSTDTGNTSSLILDGSDLSVEQKVMSTLGMNAADTFQLNLLENAWVNGVANQVTADVVVTIFSPDNENIADFDGPARGPELFQFTTKQAGLYKVVISPFEKDVGDYTMQIISAEPLESDPGKRINQLMKGLIREDGPGASIAVARDGKIIYSKGFGHANLEYDIHNTPQTIFHVASVSKQFTAFSIAMLVDQGKISLDDDIRIYLPEIYDFGTPITIRHLIHHTSGLRDQWNLLAMAGWRLDDVITKEQILRVISRQQALNFQPGEEFVYCNTGYTLLAEIVSRVSGKSFPQWTKENIFTPLAMGSTLFYDDHEKVVTKRAYSYYVSDSIFKKSVLSYANAGATSLFTTVEDLSKWAINFETMEVGNRKIMDMMEQRFVLNNGDTISYAFAQDIGKYKELKSLAHSGGDAGYRSFLLRFPDQRFSVSVLSNLASFNTGSISYAIADAYLVDLLEDEPKRETPSQSTEEDEELFDTSKIKLSDYAGRFYSSELETYYEFEVVNDTLVAHHQRHNDFKMQPVGADSFQADVWWMGNITFTRNGTSQIDGMLASSGRVRNLSFVKQ